MYSRTSIKGVCIYRTRIFSVWKWWDDDDVLGKALLQREQFYVRLYDTDLQHYSSFARSSVTAAHTPRSRWWYSERKHQPPKALQHLRRSDCHTVGLSSTLQSLLERKIHFDWGIGKLDNLSRSLGWRHTGSKTGADFRSRKSESTFGSCVMQKRLRFSTPKIGAGFRPRVSSALDGVQGGPKSKPQPNYQNIVLHRFKACQWDWINSSN